MYEIDVGNNRIISASKIDFRQKRRTDSTHNRNRRMPLPHDVIKSRLLLPFLIDAAKVEKVTRFLSLYTLIPAISITTLQVKMDQNNLGAPISGHSSSSELTSAPVMVEAIEAGDVETRPIPTTSVPHTAPSLPIRSHVVDHISTTADNSGGTRPVTSTINPNVPSSLSGPTALPTNPATHPAEQREAMKHEHPTVIAREVEKTKGAEREIKGEPVGGTVVKGIEDDRLFAMLRRFDEVSYCIQIISSFSIANSNRIYHTFFIQHPNFHQPNQISESPFYPISLRILT